MAYQRAGVASTFSPTFAAVLGEASLFARHFGSCLEVVHAAAYAEDKQRRFDEVLGVSPVVRWVDGQPPAEAIVSAAREHHYDLLIAGALQKDDGERPFTSNVARELLRRAPCDLLLLPRPEENPREPTHVVVLLEPGCGIDAVRPVLEIVRPAKVTLTANVSPFAAAIAASRGEELENPEKTVGDIAETMAHLDIEVDTRIVTSNTGFTMYDVVESLEPDLLMVQTERKGTEHALPMHMDWLNQIIPTRLLLVRGD